MNNRTTEQQKRKPTAADRLLHSMRQYGYGMGAAAKRLADYRKRAEEMQSRETCGQLYTWRDVYRKKPSKGNSIVKSDDGRKFYLDNFSEWPGYDIGDASDIVKLGHTGWYADNFQDDLIRGRVVDLRIKGKGVAYFPATYCTAWDGVTVYNDPFYVRSPSRGDSEEEAKETREDCARRADRYAELEAETARDDDAKYQAEQQIEHQREEIHAINKDLLPLIREIKRRGHEFPAAICEALKEKIAHRLEERAECFNTIANLKANYWDAVSYP